VPAAAPRPARPSRTAGGGGRRAIGAVLAAVCVLLAVAWLIERPDADDPLSQGDGPRSPVRQAHAPELPRDLAEHRYTDRPRTAPVESPGAVHPVAHDAPGAGLGAQGVTEWDIAVFPIDDSSPMQPGATGSERPAIAEPAPHRFE
jgi:hypothetical protein